MKIIWSSSIPKTVYVNPAGMYLGINWNHKTREYEEKIDFRPNEEVVIAREIDNQIICAFAGSDEYYGAVRNVVKIGKEEGQVILFVR